ncbi:hypothetical protein HP548_00690 [Paenibacillus taichungensis]|uniref:Uncharacterized protein n=1 Tax=Paenibacillus taichungensis TaxID=484184 RepID=A0ABX2MCS3_9BACL|nr:hypothetical protein [Paenibacillus taichungensis]NUU52627.1 hypothetical protein [Paenibacillus taichungensis]
MKEIDKYKVASLLGYVTDLFDKTNRLVNTTFEKPENPSPLVATSLSEIFALCEKAKLYVDLNEEIAHYEISSLFTFFDRAYFQLKEVIEKKDRNTSWLHSTFESYKSQHEIVVQMLKGI